MFVPIVDSRFDRRYNTHRSNITTSRRALELLDMAHIVGRFCIGMEGNVSTRNTDKAFYIKYSGAKLAAMRDKDVSEYAMDGVHIDGRPGSIETEVHLAIYRKFPEVEFIAHTHPVNTLKILCNDDFTGTFAEKRLYPEQVVFNGPKSCIVPYNTPGPKLAETVEVYVSRFERNYGYFPKLILLQNHGIIACGKTAAECIAITETCEKAAEVFIGAMMFEKMQTLTEEAINEIVNDQQEKYRQSLV